MAKGDYKILRQINDFKKTQLGTYRMRCAETFIVIHYTPKQNRR